MSESGGLELGLQVTVAGATARRTLLEVTLELTNTGAAALAPGVFASELLVDGRPDPSWRLALNGPIEPELVELPPGRTATLTREVGVAALAPGAHHVAVRLGEQLSPTVELEVEQATE
ncbi:hypothetical protein [Agromyces sp. H66]|uniref:hypothetical protein n=1 Tax=Agromyces sp. H66 TaxID=2529859 RepID=UPI0010AB0ECA|nr:hypothetical protein [Agromyces sp. H66]